MPPGAPALPSSARRPLCPLSGPDTRTSGSRAGAQGRVRGTDGEESGDVAPPVLVVDRRGAVAAPPPVACGRRLVSIAARVCLNPRRTSSAVSGPAGRGALDGARRPGPSAAPPRLRPALAGVHLPGAPEAAALKRGQSPAEKEESESSREPLPREKDAEEGGRVGSAGSAGISPLRGEGLWTSGLKKEAPAMSEGPLGVDGRTGGR